MERERYFEATEFENIKEIIYNSAKVYKDNTAFVIKHKEGKNVKKKDWHHCGADFSREIKFGGN